MIYDNDININIFINGNLIYFYLNWEENILLIICNLNLIYNIIFIVGNFLIIF